MRPQIDSQALARTTAEEFARYFHHLGERVEKAATAIPEDRFWTKPFTFGNSIGHLVLHLTGNLNHYIGALVVGTDYVRHREHEFTDPREAPPRRGPGEVPRGGRDGRPHGPIPGRGRVDDGRRVPGADPDPPRIVPRLCGAHEQPYRPDELPGPGAAVEHERAAGVVAARTRDRRPGSSLSGGSRRIAVGRPHEAG